MIPEQPTTPNNQVPVTKSFRIGMVIFGLICVAGTYMLIAYTSHYIWGCLCGLIALFFVVPDFAKSSDEIKAANRVFLAIAPGYSVLAIGYSVYRGSHPTEADRTANLIDKIKADRDALKVENEKADEEQQARKDAEHTELLDAKIYAEDYLKANLRDPSSLDIESEAADHVVGNPQGVYIVVRIVYRAKNGFGGMNKNAMTFRFNKKLKLIGIPTKDA